MWQPTTCLEEREALATEVRPLRELRTHHVSSVKKICQFNFLLVVLQFFVSRVIFKNFTLQKLCVLFEALYDLHSQSTDRQNPFATEACMALCYDVCLDQQGKATSCLEFKLNEWSPLITKPNYGSNIPELFV